MLDEDVKIFNAFILELSRESDRGLALIGAAFLDEKLAETLEALFAVPAKDLVYGKNAPIGNFSARIEVCFALGLIDEVEKNDIDYIRKIRNEFAHKVTSLSFIDRRMSDICSNFKSALPEDDKTHKFSARFKFQNAVISMASRLYYRPVYVLQEKRQPKTWVDPDSIRWRRTVDEKPAEGQPVIGVVVSPPRTKS